MCAVGQVCRDRVPVARETWAHGSIAVQLEIEACFPAVEEGGTVCSEHRLFRRSWFLQLLDPSLVP